LVEPAGEFVPIGEAPGGGERSLQVVHVLVDNGGAVDVELLGRVENAGGATELFGLLEGHLLAAARVGFLLAAQRLQPGEQVRRERPGGGAAFRGPAGAGGVGGGPAGLAGAGT